MDFALLTFIVTISALIGTVLLRKRILAAVGRIISTRAIEFVRTTYFVEVEDETGDTSMKVLRPSPALQSLFASIVPSLVQTVLRSVKLKSGGTLPLNPATGQLDFMAPVLTKIAAGRKIGLEDFLPLIMDRAMPIVEGFLGGIGKGGGKTSSEKLPEHMSHTSK